MPGDFSEGKTFRDLVAKCGEHFRSIEDANTIVIKLGSSLILRESEERRRQGVPSMEIDRDRLSAFIKSISEMVIGDKAKKREIVFVSSGAVGLGRSILKINKSEEKLEDKQAAAAVGNADLIKYYVEEFKNNGVIAGQVLMTPQNTDHSRSRHNIRKTIFGMLKRNVVPIINENDAVTTYGIRYGDNDSLASLVAKTITADTVVLFTDILGFYTNFGEENQGLEIFSEGVSREHISGAGGAGTDVGTGGMATKVNAARIATEQAGCNLVIACGRDPIATFLHEKQLLSGKTGKKLSRRDDRDHSNVSRLFKGNLPFTIFKSRLNPAQARSLAIYDEAMSKYGKIVITEFEPGRDILPEYILAVSGEADRGEAIRIIERRQLE